MKRNDTKPSYWSTLVLIIKGATLGLLPWVLVFYWMITFAVALFAIKDGAWIFPASIIVIIFSVAWVFLVIHDGRINTYEDGSLSYVFRQGLSKSRPVRTLTVISIVFSIFHWYLFFRMLAEQ